MSILSLLHALSFSSGMWAWRKIAKLGKLQVFVFGSIWQPILVSMLLRHSHEPASLIIWGCFSPIEMWGIRPRPWGFIDFNQRGERCRLSI